MAKLRSDFDRESAYADFKEAVLALTLCWDYLGHLEDKLDLEVEEQDIAEFAGDDDWSPEAFALFLKELAGKERVSVGGN